MNFNLEIPLNSSSLGQIGHGIAYEMYNRGLSPNIFVIGAADLKCFAVDSKFQFWLESCVKKALREYKKPESTIRWWHIIGSERRLTDRNILYTTHETDQLTPTEVNILDKYDQVLLPSNYSTNVFKESGLENVDVCPHFFDSLHFKTVDTPKVDAITFGIFGKLEKRKHTRNAIVSWANQFANKKEFRLVCQIFNPFLNPEAQDHEINAWFGGRRPWNITFLPFQEKIEDYNKVLNSIDVGIFLQGAEGFNLPAFTCLALGKQCVVLNAHAHCDFANEDNAILVEPSGKEEIYDNIFFQKGADFNQGSMYTFSQEAVHNCYNKSLDKIKNGCIVNEAGLALQQNFTVQKTVDKLLSYI